MGVYASQKEILVAANNYHYATAWRIIDTRTECGNRTFYLHHILINPSIS